jgi:hypothetical protein
MANYKMTIDQALCNEIALCFVNEYKGYKQIKTYCQTLAKHKARKQFDPTLARQGLIRIVSAYLTQYRRDNGMPSLRCSHSEKEAIVTNISKSYSEEFPILSDI